MVIKTLKIIVTRYPVPVLVLLTALSILAGLALPDLETDPSPELLAPDHESRLAVDRLREDFTGANNGIIVMLSVAGTDQETVFNLHTLERVQELTRAFESIHLITKKDRNALAAAGAAAPSPIRDMALNLAASLVNEDTWLGVDELLESLSFADPPLPELEALLSEWPEKLSPVEKVSSLSATDNILAREGRLEVSPIYESVPEDSADLDRLEKEVVSNDLFSGLLVSNQGRNTSINIELALDEGAVKERYQVYSQVVNLLESKIPGPEIHYIAGFPAVTAALGKAMEEDSKTLFAIVFLIVLFCLYINFKGIKGVVLPLVVVLLSLVVTLGVMAAASIPLNVITISLPVFVLSIGVADGIHMFSEYQDHIDEGLDKIAAVCQTLDHLTMPVIMTSLTTGAAFFAISITRIVQVKYCGLFVCLGALVAMVFSLLFIPSLLVCLPQKKRLLPIQKKKGKKRIYVRILIGFTRWVVKRSGLTTTFCVLVFAVFLVGALQVKVDNNTVGFFKSDSPIFLSSQALNKYGAGSARINFVISLDPEFGNHPFKQPLNLEAVHSFIDFLKAQPEVGKVTDLTQLIQRIHFVLNDQDPAQDRLPVDPDLDPVSSRLIAQLLLLYENGGGDVLSDYVDPAYSRLNISTVLRTNSSRETKAFTDRARAWAKTYLPGPFEMEITGSAAVEAATTREIVNGQITGLSVSVLVVLVMLGITFRNRAYTLIAMIPLVGTIVINFGVMGFFNIPLDIGTAIIASVVIGIGVDYSIHYLSRLKAGLAQGLEFEQALDDTVAHAGKAIVSNALTVGCGFIALWFAFLTPLIVMGWLITLTMVVSALASLVLLPVLVRLTCQFPVQGRSIAPNPGRLKGELRS